MSAAEARTSLIQLSRIDCVMNEVFVLWHVHDLGDGEEDSKLIGIYGSQEDAEAAKVRLGLKPGFIDAPHGFITDRYRLNKDHWSDGYITVYPRTDDSVKVE